MHNGNLDTHVNAICFTFHKLNHEIDSGKEYSPVISHAEPEDPFLSAFPSTMRETGKETSGGGQVPDSFFLIYRMTCIL